MSAPSVPAASELPEVVRTRVVSLVSDVLALVTPLPPALRKVADFAPARRARLGARAIEAALHDDEFRTRAATQVRARLADLADALEEGTVPDEADRVDLAALAWLGGVDDWASHVDAAAEQHGPVRDEARNRQELDRARERAESLEQSLRDARAEHRTRLEEQKAENTLLRRRLGEARATARATAAELADALSARDDATGALEQATTRADAEVRRLRAQVDQLTGELQAARRDSRSERDEASIRARLLLETLLDAATGLRRELALPPVSGLPADRVDARAAEPGTATTSAAGALGPSSPALLEHLLALPRSRLLVDGYNVSKTAWPSSSLEAQRARLVTALAPVVARTGAETTVVFDAGATSSRPVVSAPRGVRVVFSPEGVIADDVIVDYVAAEPSGRVVVVVTSDQALAARVREHGGRVVWSAALIGLLAT